MAKEIVANEIDSVTILILVDGFLQLGELFADANSLDESQSLF